MEGIEFECSTLDILFQQIVADIKVCFPIWEDFIGKASKLQIAIRTTIIASSIFLESFQKLADAATNIKGGSTLDLGAGLTRLCIRQKSIEDKLKHFSSCLFESLIVPLQENLEEFKRNTLQLDKEHNKEFKRHSQDIKKSTSELIRLKKKNKKFKVESQRQLDMALVECSSRHKFFESVKRNAVNNINQINRSQFSFFIQSFAPVIDCELAMLNEVHHIEEIMTSLSKCASLKTGINQVNELGGRQGNQVDSAENKRSPMMLPIHYNEPQTIGSLSIHGGDSRKSSISSLTTPSPSHLPSPLNIHEFLLEDSESTYKSISSYDEVTNQQQSNANILDNQSVSNVSNSYAIPYDGEHQQHQQQLETDAGGYMKLIGPQQLPNINIKNEIRPGGYVNMGQLVKQELAAHQLSIAWAQQQNQQANDSTDTEKSTDHSKSSISSDFTKIIKLRDTCNEANKLWDFPKTNKDTIRLAAEHWIAKAKTNKSLTVEDINQKTSFASSVRRNNPRDRSLPPVSRKSKSARVKFLLTPFVVPQNIDLTEDSLPRLPPPELLQMPNYLDELSFDDSALLPLPPPPESQIKLSKSLYFENCN